MLQHAWQIFTEQAIQKEQPAYERQRPTHHATRCLKYQYQRDHANHHIGVGQCAGSCGEIGLEYPVVKAEGKTDNAQ